MTATREHALELIGLIPAAGQATRISPSPCSKEIFPVGLRADPKNGTMRPKVVSHYLLEKMRLAGVSRAFFILRNGKWDIPAYFGDGSMLEMSIGYLMMGRPDGPPYSLDQAYPFVQNALVALGFPDILFTPEDAFVQMIARQKTSQADVVLGLFPAHTPGTLDMVDVDDDGRVRSISLKPGQTTLRYTWLAAVWSPAFTSFLHHHLGAPDPGIEPARFSAPTELTVGHILSAGVLKGLRVDSVVFSKGTYVDIGTSEGLGKVFTFTSNVSPGAGAF